MNYKNGICVIGLSVFLVGCGDDTPTVNSINCSPPGMERVLPGFTNETDRQAFIDACKSFAEEK